MINGISVNGACPLWVFPQPRPNSVAPQRGRTIESAKSPARNFPRNINELEKVETNKTQLFQRWHQTDPSVSDSNDSERSRPTSVRLKYEQFQLVSYLPSIAFGFLDGKCLI
jgi:hypothetical protein